MGTEVHTQTSTEIHETQTPDGGERRSWREGEAWQSFNAIVPWLFRAAMVAGSALVIYVGFHDANAEQTTAIREIKDRQTAMQTLIDTKSDARDKQINGLVDKELFNERTVRMQKDIDEIKTGQNEIRDLLIRRLPPPGPGQ